MSEKPKSIWKRPLHGWRGWLLAAALIFAVIMVIGWFAGADTMFTMTVAGILIMVSLVVGLGVSLFRWLFWTHWRRGLFALACFATLIALFYAEEDWRGWHTWNSFKQEWEAKGEHFDMAGVTPAPVPDEQNFAMTPIAFTSYGRVLTRDGKHIPYDTNLVERIKMEITHDYNSPTNVAGDREKGKFTNLEGWQRYYRELATKTNEFAVPAQPQSPAADVLLALGKYDPVIEELRAASRLPYSRFPLQYTNESPGAILLPHLAALKSCAQILRLRSLSELQNGQPDKALDDVILALQLTDKIHTEPFLISHLVRIAMLQIMLQPVWEGLAEHRWSDAQLAALDAELAKFDFLPDYKLSMRGELGCQGGEMDRLRRHPEQLADLAEWGDGDGDSSKVNLPGGLIARLIPTGWFYQNQLHCARVMVNYFIPAADLGRGTFSPDLARRGDATIKAETKSLNAYNLIEKLMLPALANATRKFAHGQASVNLARTAIALERYRLAHGEFPESLDALTPQFISKVPHDVIGGQPLKYRREANGRFVLYSVGWNETDDGGVAAFKKDPSTAMDISQGDWVWQYPAK